MKKNKPKLKTTVIAPKATLPKNTLSQKVLALEDQIANLNIKLSIFELEMACKLDPENLTAFSRLANFFNENGLPLPDEILERHLRSILHKNPFDIDATIPLVSLMMRADRMPAPSDQELLIGKLEPIDNFNLDYFLENSHKAFEVGDAVRCYAYLWQSTLRFKNSGMPWASYANYFSLAGLFSYSIYAIEKLKKVKSELSVDEYSLVTETCARMQEAGTEIIHNFPVFKVAKSSSNSLIQVANVIQMKVLKNQPLSELSTIETALEHHAIDPRLNRIAFLAFYKRAEFEKSYHYLEGWIKSDPLNAPREVNRSYSTQYVEVCEKVDRVTQIPLWVGKQWGSNKQSNLLPAHPTIESFNQAYAAREVAQARNLPFALVITQEKSASVSIGNIFGNGFSLPSVMYSLTKLCVIDSWAKDFAKGGGYYITHLRPTESNIVSLVKSGLTKAQVNIRDPRGALVSLSFHYEKYANLYPQESARKWLSLNFDERIDYLIKNELPHMIKWIEGWIIASQKMQIIFSTYEQFVDNQNVFIDQILEGYSGSKQFFNRDAAMTMSKGVDYHIRIGKSESWRSELSPTQVESINRSIPNSWFKKFSWTP